MAVGIMIMGAPGAGKTTLGELTAKALGYAFLDIDEYIWRKDTDAESRWERFDLVEQCIRNAAARISNATVLCGIDLVPHDEGYYADLRLHPNDAGFDCYFERLWPEVKAALKG